MEEMNMNMMMNMMMKMTTQETPPPNHNHNHNHNHHPNHNPKIPMITTTTSPTWKLYENPFYTFNNQQQKQKQMIFTTTTDHKQIHKVHLPISSRKIAASFFDLTFIKPFMDSELQSQITIVKSQLESAIRARKKTDSLNKKLARELSEERRGRHALERLCEELAREVSADKAEITRMRRDIDEERKMLRTAEIIREERVQMKLSEAKMLMEEKLTELQTSTTIMKLHQHHSHSNNDNDKNNTSMSFGEKVRFVFGDKINMNMNMNMHLQRKSGGETTENPHIKRGIKGFVEFPKVVKAIGCRSSNSNSNSNSKSKLECQKAQLKILLKQKGTSGLMA